MEIKYRSSMHLDRQNAQLGTKHGIHCRLTMGLMIGTTCLYSKFGYDEFWVLILLREKWPKCLREKNRSVFR